MPKETSRETQKLKLEDLISVDVLQKVQDNFSTAVGIAMIIVDREGVPITEPSNFSPFCQTIRTTGARRDLCFLCDNDGGRRAMATGEPSIYQCHCGLVDFAAPIIVRDQYLGAFIAGQVRLSDGNEVNLEHIIPPDSTWRQDKKLQTLHDEIREITYPKLRSAAYTLFFLAEYLVEESYAAATQQELSAQTLRLMEESKQRVELEKSLREAELQALSYQVNPHFLFNVLNTIGRLALAERAGRTESIVCAFADMMRYILKKGKSQNVSLRSEMTHVRNYLSIQEVRMGDRFTYSLDVPEKYESMLCPFMSLHPLVENCINYAVEPREGGGKIDIRARDDGKDLILDIADNGDGIEPEILRAALDGVNEHRGRVSIGLHNVDSRLRHFFGNDYGLVVESPGTPGGGTLVRVRIPLEYDPCDV